MDGFMLKALAFVLMQTVDAIGPNLGKASLRLL